MTAQYSYLDTESEVDEVEEDVVVGGEVPQRLGGGVHVCSSSTTVAGPGGLPGCTD